MEQPTFAAKKPGSQVYKPGLPVREQNSNHRKNIIKIAMGLVLIVFAFLAVSYDWNSKPSKTEEPSKKVQEDDPKYCDPNNKVVTIITTVNSATPTLGDTIDSSLLKCKNDGILKPQGKYTCSNNILKPEPICNQLCPTPSGMKWKNVQPIVGDNIDITSLKCINNATPSPSTGNYKCGNNGINVTLTCKEGYENYIDQIFSWISGRPDINSSSKYSLLPGYYS